MTFRLSGAARWSFAPILLAGAVAAFTGCGTGDLTGEKCAKPLVGDEICGDDLTAFCETHYSPQINADTCDPVLKDAGKDPVAILAAQAARDKANEKRAAAKQAAADKQAAEAATTRVEVGKPGEIGGLRVTVEAPEVKRSVGDEYTTSTAKSGRHFLVLDLAVDNVGDKPMSLCMAESSVQLISTDDKVFTADSEASINAGAAELCGDDLQPGDSASVPVVFNLRDSVKPAGAMVWEPGSYSTQATDPHLAVGF